MLEVTTKHTRYLNLEEWSEFLQLLPENSFKK